MSDLCDNAKSTRLLMQANLAAKGLLIIPNHTSPIAVSRDSAAALMQSLGEPEDQPATLKPDAHPV